MINYIVIFIFNFIISYFKKFFVSRDILCLPVLVENKIFEDSIIMEFALGGGGKILVSMFTNTLKQKLSAECKCNISIHSAFCYARFE